MNNFDVIFNDKGALELGLKVIKRPSISVAQKNIEQKEVKGRNGSLLIDYGTYKNIEITVNFNFVNRDDFNNKCRLIKKWVTIIKNNKLKFTDDTEYFLKVKHVKCDNIERSLKVLGKLNVTFICDPFMHREDGLNLINICNSTIYNEGFECAPTYIITGNGVCELKVNDNIVKINVADSIDIVTSLQLCHKNKIISNSSMQGYFEDLYLKNGENTINFTNGFIVSMIPNWRCL